MPFPRKSRKPRAFLDESALYNYAVKALGRQMRTESELRRLMQSRAEPGDSGEAAVRAAITRLKQHGYLDDRAYAETYARLRQENEKFGASRVRQDLQRKGIRTELVKETVDARYGETDEEKLARDYLSRKRLPKPESPKGIARVMRRLVAAGFSTATIYKVLRRWDVSEEELAALDDADAEPREED